jgi:hypothetical protein
MSEFFKNINILIMKGSNQVKSVKGKVLTGVVAFGVITGAGWGFANTDAGGALKGWYDGQFASAKSGVESDAMAYGNSKFNEGVQEFEGMQSDATTSINDKKSSEFTRADGEISSAKDSHVNAIEGKQAEISDAIDEQFDQIFTDAQSHFTTLEKTLRNAGISEMQHHTNEKGQEALAALETDLTNSTTTAVSELRGVIETAKAELTAQLNSEKAATTQEIKNMVDAKAVAVLQAIENKKNEYVAAQEQAITELAANLEAEAKAALDAELAAFN